MVGLVLDVSTQNLPPDMSVNPGDSTTLAYKRSLFTTRLPLPFRYSTSHYWLFEKHGVWRVGLTQFATRMVGEIVDYGFEVHPGSMVRLGQVLGWIEGMKAVSDLCCVIDGSFSAHNPLLSQDPEVIARDCYGQGWLYQVAGTPDPGCVNAEGYKEVLDETIDRLVEKQQS
jgi:glycine cleavage system H protein